tara:strand:- start:70 stop:336 length:267 start_codon:yes stop_codon:yes gene_type:complete
MILPPVTPEYNSASQAVLNETLAKADEQNFKLDQDNFLDTGSICMKDANGNWYILGVNTSGVLTVTQLAGTQLDADGRPSIASVNPYS